MGSKVCLGGRWVGTSNLSCSVIEYFYGKLEIAPAGVQCGDLWRVT